METQKIKAILSALQYGSLSKAAEVISYTPSAMSHIADSLEKELGVKILERSPLGISLTPEGEALYAHMTAMVEAEKRLRTAAEEIVNARENHLRIGAFSSISQHLLPEVIGQFKREHPEIRISLSVDDKLQDWLEKGLADVIFTDEFTYGDNLWVPIKEDPFVAVVPSGILNGKRSVTREELYPYTYISINEQILHSYFDHKTMELTRCAGARRRQFLVCEAFCHAQKVKKTIPGVTALGLLGWRFFVSASPASRHKKYYPVLYFLKWQINIPE